MKLRGAATIQDYRDAFDRIDSDDSGYIEAGEVAELFDDVYDGKAPPIEVKAFMKFFDQNKDGRISWDEFEQGLGAALSSTSASSSTLDQFLLQADDGDDDDSISVKDPAVSGTIEVELENGKIVTVDANVYMESLKKEAEALKEAIAREKGITRTDSPQQGVFSGSDPSMSREELGGIAEYIANRQGDVKSLTEGISPEIVDTMKMLVDFVLEAGDNSKGKNTPKEKMEMEIPSSALQQLALWQLVLGYKLREAEATGDYLKLLD